MEHNNISRPSLKGISHVIAAIGYMCVLCTMDYAKMPTLVIHKLRYYLVFETANFLCSGILHYFMWENTVLRVLRIIDHVIIYFKIICTYMAIVTTILGEIDPSVMQIVYISSLFGIASRILFTDISRLFIAVPYFFTAFALFVDPGIIYILFIKMKYGSLLLLSGGCAYVVGGIIYMLGKPNLFPGVFGFHELYHLCTIIGSIFLTLFIIKCCVPYYIQEENILRLYT